MPFNNYKQSKLEINNFEFDLTLIDNANITFNKNINEIQLINNTISTNIIGDSFSFKELNRLTI